LDERRHLVVRIESARTGQHPDRALLEAIRLQAERRLRATEGMAIGAQAQKRHAPRAIAAHLPCKPPAARDEFFRPKLIGAGGCACHEIGQPVPLFEQQVLFRRMQQPGRKARGVERRPEAVAGPGEVMAGGSRVKAGIDAAKKDAQIRRDHVPQTLAARRFERSAVRPGAGCSRPTSRPAQA
jgi:hypothetical protein